jgi:hypothetical protein
LAFLAQIFGHSLTCRRQVANGFMDRIRYPTEVSSPAPSSRGQEISWRWPEGPRIS